MSPPSAPDEASADITTSDLSDGKQRFLSLVVAHALSSGLRSARDFIRHFPPKAIMLALATQPRLRAKIIVPAIGLHEKVALKKTAESTGDDLQIALEEHVVDEDAIIRLFDPDDRVRFLDEMKLWAFVVEGDFWKTTPSKATELAVAKKNLAFMIDCARTNGLITDRHIVEGLTLDGILSALPKSELTRIVRFAVTGGLNRRPFDDEALLAALPPAQLLDYIPTSHMWESVVLARIAAAHGFVKLPSVVPPSPLAGASDDEVVLDALENDSPETESRESEAGEGKPRENESREGKPAGRGRGRRIVASDLSEVKSEIEDANDKNS